MEPTTFVFVLFLKFGYAGGVIQMKFDTLVDCNRMLGTVRSMETYRDSTPCVQVNGMAITAKVPF